MSFKTLRLVGFLFVLMLAVAVHAGGGGASISISSAPTGQSPDTCDDVELEYHFVIPDASTDDGGGTDWFAIAMTDGRGNFVDTDWEGESVGSVDDFDTFDGEDPAVIKARPITFSLYDITDPGAIDENTVEGHNFATSGTLLAQTTFDPGTLTINGTCDSLPFGSGSCLSLPAGSVVGNTPYQVQVYWAPDKVSPGIFLNPGNYWVIGQDESGKFYEIMLSCQFVWVPVQDFQPSFEPPQNGQPLPTTVVK
jgi:hypothetical protein